MGRVQSLVEIATNKCIRHVNQLQDLGDIQYHIVKPILRKMNAKQLSQVEDNCHQLMPMSDELWYELLRRDFPNRPIQLKKQLIDGPRMPSKGLYQTYSEEQESFRKDSTERLKRMTNKLKMQKSKNSVIEVEQILRDPTVKVNKGPKNSILNKARRELLNRSLMFPKRSVSGIRNQSNIRPVKSLSSEIIRERKKKEDLKVKGPEPVQTKVIQEPLQQNERQDLPQNQLQSKTANINPPEISPTLTSPTLISPKRKSSSLFLPKKRPKKPSNSSPTVKPTTSSNSNSNSKSPQSSQSSQSSQSEKSSDVKSIKSSIFN